MGQATAGLVDVMRATGVREAESAAGFILTIGAKSRVEDPGQLTKSLGSSIGNVMATVQSRDPLQVITIRPTAFSLADVGEEKTEIEIISFVAENSYSRFVQLEQHQNDRPDLESAAIVISGGRGLKDSATFKRLEVIAEKMGAAMGASRAAVDAGLAPNDWQVGQTGKVVAPTLYIAVGISGAIQHCAGMKDSKLIVAINKDPDAPIFQIADYALVADINSLLDDWERCI